MLVRKVGDILTISMFLHLSLTCHSHSQSLMHIILRNHLRKQQLIAEKLEDYSQLADEENEYEGEYSIEDIKKLAEFQKQRMHTDLLNMLKHFIKENRPKPGKYCIAYDNCEFSYYK